VPIPDPRVNRGREQVVLEGDVPSPANPPAACRFHTRCPRASDICSEVEPDLVEHRPRHWAACHHPYNVGAGGDAGVTAKAPPLS
jgi:oligopeptide/dipeptide ABC transporter ATP-binding protein